MYLLKRNYPKLCITISIFLFLFCFILPMNNFKNSLQPTNYFKREEIHHASLINWWKRHPHAPRGLSCRDDDDLSAMKADEVSERNER